MEYLDFDLEVTAADGGAFTVRVLRSPAGEATGTMRLPFDELVLQNRLQALQIALLRSGTTRRRIETAESHTVAKFGAELWDALFSDDIRARFEASRSEARRLDAGMRIKLRFEDASLAALPWEYLFDPGRGDYVTLSASTPVVRYISLPQVMEPLAVRPPLRVLGMIASPSDLEELDVERERQRLEQALAKLVDAGLIELVWMTGSTARDLQAMLRRGPWHIFHFVGHGGFDANRGEGLIALTTEAGTSDRISATDLGRLLGDHDPLRLAVLNACESARGDSVDVFASTAATLVRRGTPAVVAMQYEITDDAAIEFSRSFYEAIADDVPVDAALAEARKGVAVAIPGTLEWGTPVLYMRAPDGVLFDIPAEARAAAVVSAAVTRPLTEAAVVVEAVEPPPVEPPIVEPPLVEPPRVVEPPPVVATPAPIRPIVAPSAEPSPPPPTPVAPSPVPAASTPAPFAAPSPPPAAPGAGRGSGGNTKAIIAVGGVLLFVGVVFALALGGIDPGPTFPPLPPASEGGVVPPTRPPFVPPTRPPFVPPTQPVIVPPVSAGGRIVFSNDSTGNADLYSSDPAGTDMVQLTSDPGDDQDPALSPDGRRIAFTRITDGQGAVWVMDADGTNQQKVFDSDAYDWAPAWMPNGSALVFSSNRFESDKRIGDLFTIGLDGSVSPTFMVGILGIDEDRAAVGADGRVAFASGDGDGLSRSIYIVGGVGAIPQQMTEPGWIDGEPTWAPDQDSLLFSRASDQNRLDRNIWSFRTSDRSYAQLTTDPGDEGHPASAPDGLWYAFHRNVGGAYHVIVVDTTGTGHDITGGLAGNSLDPTWR